MYRPPNIKASLITLSLYCILVVSSTLYWGTNFSSFTHYKGDEFFYFLEYLLGLTLLYFVAQLLCLRQLKYLPALIVPFVTVVSSVFVGFLLLAVTPIDGTPSEIIYVYGTGYSVTNVLFSAAIISKYAKRQGQTP